MTTYTIYFSHDGEKWFPYGQSAPEAEGYAVNSLEQAKIDFNELMQKWRFPYPCRYLRLQSRDGVYTEQVDLKNYWLGG